MTSPTRKVTSPGLLTSPRPTAAAVEGDRHHRQPERAVEAGEPGAQRRCSPGGTRAFGKMSTGSDFGEAPCLAASRCAAPSPRVAVDGDDAVTRGRPAEQRNRASSCLSTTTGFRARRTISIVSYIDWCLTAIRCGPGGSALRRCGCRASVVSQRGNRSSHGRRRASGPGRQADTKMQPAIHPQSRRVEDGREQQRASSCIRYRTRRRSCGSTIFVIFAETGEEARLASTASTTEYPARPVPGGTRSARGACASRW